MQSLFQAYTLNNGVEVKNRLVVAPMTHWGSDANGHITHEEREFIKDRAEDFGMFISAATLVAHGGKSFDGEPHAIDESDLESLSELANTIKSQGAKAILQLHHGGYTAIPELTNGLDVIAPSAINSAREMSADEIEALVVAFGNATKLAIKAGFDGVEIHGANGYLIQQFYSAQSNLREDKWGGNLQKRMKFPLAVTDAVIEAKKSLNKPEFIIGYRFSPEEPGDNGITMSETFALVDELCKKELQYLHISLHDFFVHARRGANTNRTRIEQIHERIGGKLPLIGVGNLLSSEDIQKAVSLKSTEFIALGKSVMINPNMATLLKNDEFDKIETTLDADKKDSYRFPKKLWKLIEIKLDFLPKIKE
ncbi:NADH-dependent flavin oxidoreductase [Campylobacter sp. RM13119]|uniref:NADH-dependent flavin oxidoreductase n=1 Tax=Campylobacter californiensis TaxID=1032243 RepID=UPI0014742DEB|nr:NADH-dependent flavin oxidoreductase [Campylobacter sp. RM13119]MBE3606692.1 NADH-dependent flavin oxidoreductase [Campylobacter sp. RM13119]